MSNGITRVQVWRDTDGGYHETEALAQLAQDEINLVSKLSDIIDSIYYNGIRPYELVAGIRKHLQEIREILK